MIPTYTNPSGSIISNPYISSQTITPNTIQTFFVSGEQEAAISPNPTMGCSLYLNRNEQVMYAKYADGRPMETYDLVKREPPKPPEFVTREDFDKKFDEIMSILKHNNYQRKEKHNG